jgi:mono/diheme cytochrome c family protein
MKKTVVIRVFSAMAMMPALSIAAEPASEHPTYAKEVSRIIQDNCQICHQPGQIGPMSFTSYEEIRPWAPLTRLKVMEREMPPYQYDHDIGVQELKDEWRMSEEDINTLVAWVDAGSPMGNLEDLPLPKEYPAVGEWRLGEELGPPDHIIQSTAWDVPAAGQDLRWEPEVPTGITTSRCIKAVETPPSAAAHGSTHHAIRFDMQGVESNDREGIYAKTLTAPVGKPVTLTAYTQDRGNRIDYEELDQLIFPLGSEWILRQGPAMPEFASEKITGRDRAKGSEGGSDDWTTVQTEAIFWEPGEYIIRLRVDNFEAPDSQFDNQRCWSNAYIPVTVTP